ncbi:hypothetical protein B4094_0117 [Bacillus licheniformis]|nr:hypothetical protein B4094_0117 [Bacillus licheniformis]TWK29731.1 hypothetical protein CHCC20369_1078 [Bacillus licheniformis]TWK34233.1 hypothetical protein CHCC20368_0715 [Bacillus licheniformis]
MTSVKTSAVLTDVFYYKRLKYKSAVTKRGIKSYTALN